MPIQFRRNLYKQNCFVQVEQCWFMRLICYCLPRVLFFGVVGILCCWIIILSLYLCLLHCSQQLAPEQCCWFVGLHNNLAYYHALCVWFIFVLCSLQETPRQVRRWEALNKWRTQASFPALLYYWRGERCVAKTVGKIILTKIQLSLRLCDYRFPWLSFKISNQDQRLAIHRQDRPKKY